MPLYAVDSDRPIDYLPHKQEFDICRTRLADAAYHAVENELNRRIDAVAENPQPVLTSSWLPGPDWTGTVYEPLYHAASNDQSRSGMFFGQILWQVMRERREDWAFLKADPFDLGIQGTHYFRIHR